MKFNKLTVSKVITSREMVGEAWQVINNKGQVVALLDANGVNFEAPVDADGNVLPTESVVVEENTTPPFVFEQSVNIDELVASLPVTEEQGQKISSAIADILANGQ